jgi:three-Cys-motif partner protein
VNQDDLSQKDLYSGRGQTLVKHLILRKYLQRFAHIIGFKWETITYVDCFAGPWNVRSEDLKDSSFSIALEELRKARQTHQNLKLRCFFLEKKAKPFAKLKKFADKVTDAEVEPRNAALEESISDIVEFVKQGGANSFPFIFIDPTGWTGFPMDVIAPLLRLDTVEVLINFMTGDIRRFLESPQQATQESFKRLYRSEEIIDKIQGLQGQDREDVAVAEYRKQVAKTGNFNYTAAAMVLHPLFDRTRFHLIYATRNEKGIEVFKEAEKKAMEEQERERASAQYKRREAKTGQRSFFTAEESYNPSFYESLRDRYISQSKECVLRMLQTNKRVSYDEVWAAALELPLVWESDLKEWITGWEEKKLVSVEGKRSRQKVPHRNEGNILHWH